MPMTPCNLTHPWRDAEGDKLGEECGIFGAINAADAAAITALGLHALQHRGQEAAGIVSYDGQEFYARRGLGHVAENFSNAEAIAALPGHMAAGHVRYSTTGGSGLRNVQPLYADLASGGFAVAHNGNISNAGALRADLVSKGSIFQSTSDTEVIIHLVATSRYPTIADRLVDALRLVEGAYALIVMTPEGMIACRDPLGIRPLVMGRMGPDNGGAIVFASETVAFDVVGAERIREVEPGELVLVNFAGEIRSVRPFGSLPPRPCIFEHVYFSRPDSVFAGRSVYEARKAIGIQLAREAPCHADVVVPVPDSGVPAAIGFAQESGLPFELGIVRSHYVGRTFIQPGDGARHSSVKRKHNANRALVERARCISASPARPRPIPASMGWTRPSAPSCSPRGWSLRRCAPSSRPTASPSSRSRGFIARWARRGAIRPARNSAMPASPATIPPASPIWPSPRRAAPSFPLPIPRPPETA
jgi:amidophosphoribosyltransferase